MAVSIKIFLLFAIITSLLLKNINCDEIQWNSSAVAFGIPELYRQQAKNHHEVKTLLERQIEIQTRTQNRDCSELAFKGDYPTGPYTITPRKGLKYDVNVYCDMDTNGGGWTVFQRRFDGTTTFYRGWSEYESGFGNSDSEFWAGLKVGRITFPTIEGDIYYPKIEA